MTIFHITRDLFLSPLQLWLITHFHPLGSLYEHLSRVTLTRAQMMALVLSAARGLLHLHTEIHGTQVITRTQVFTLTGIQSDGYLFVHRY
jgi:hypothetical protein